MITTHTRRIIAEVLDRIIQRDIDRRGIRATLKLGMLSIDVSVLDEFSAAMRLDYDGDDVVLANAAVDAVTADEDGRHELTEPQHKPEE